MTGISNEQIAKDLAAAVLNNPGIYNKNLDGKTAALTSVRMYQAILELLNKGKA
jgi:hypothetical protein